MGWEPLVIGGLFVLVLAGLSWFGMSEAGDQKAKRADAEAARRAAEGTADDLKRFDAAQRRWRDRTLADRIRRMRDRARKLAESDTPDDS